MIVVDTSALMAIALDAPEAGDCMMVLQGSDDVHISAGTLAELLIVADRRGVGDELRIAMAALNVQVVPFTAEAARLAADAYRQWGKGVHAAKLNFGDCFAYVLAMQRAAPLLFVGNDFAQTDVRSALPPRPAPTIPPAT